MSIDTEFALAINYSRFPILYYLIFYDLYHEFIQKPSIWNWIP